MTTVKTVKESNYPEMMKNQINIFWQQRNEGFFEGKKQKKLYWVSMTSPHHSKAIVVVNGRVETTWKYQELFYHFFTLGYDIYSFDHRGQGLSDRLTEDKEIGHIEYFSYYVEDMAMLIDQFNLSKYQHRFLVAHSMGGAIAARYLLSYKNHNFNALALSAPMFGVNISPILKPIAPYWSYFIDHVSSKPRYLTKNRAYQSKPFDSNPLTSSHARYQWFQNLYEEMPQLKIGGPSARWIWQSLTSAKTCIKQAQKITIPVLLLQAGKDVIVSNQAQLEFIMSLEKNGTTANLERLEKSKHEILFENDSIRNRALQTTHDFFEHC